MANRRFLRVCFLWFLVLILLPFGVLTAQNERILNVGAQGQDVANLQEKLVKAGFLNSQIDGKYGKATSEAVLALQEAMIEQGHDIKADGIAGPQTLALVYDADAMRPFVDFGPGATGQRVVALQVRLIDLKFLDCVADGVFGQNTLEALLAFQKHMKNQNAEGIVVSGLADEATREWLFSNPDIANMKIQAPEFFDDSRPLQLSDQFLNAKAAILVRTDTGQILYAKNPDLVLYPASTTKIMTLLLAVEKGDLERLVTLPQSTGEIPQDSSLVPVYPGEEMTMEDLLYGLMIRSGNDAANAVAEITEGSLEKFVQTMNERARQMKLRNTQFINPHGYHDPQHYTTARDLAAISLHMMANPQGARIASAVEYQMSATQKRGELRIVNNNELLNPLSTHYYPGAFGIKSGYTSAAGFCYAGMAARNQGTLLAVILGSRTRNRGWDDMSRLFNYGFEKLAE
jgi:D-alanyl-D-alanine carboxypeptidase (penicillin-binding protein 5/6)